MGAKNQCSTRMPKGFLVLVVLVLGLTSCKNIDSSNYKQLKVGMEYGEVTSIIGKPDTCTAMLNMKNCMWSDKAKEIRVKFVGEQVVFTASRGLGQ